MTYASVGRKLESVPGLTVANTSTPTVKQVLFHKAIKVQHGMSGINGPTTLGVRGAHSNEDVEIVQLQRHVAHQQIPRKYASCIRRDNVRRATASVR